MRWWVNVLPEVVSGIQSFGFTDPPPDKVLESVEQNLSNHGELWTTERWEKSPDDYFVYTHGFIESGRPGISRQRHDRRSRGIGGCLGRTSPIRGSVSETNRA
jgi:hypothetical protein